MLDLRRLRLLRELSERGTIAAVADALQFTPSAVSQQLATAAGSITGRVRIAGFQSVILRLALPAMQALSKSAPRLRAELVESEPEEALPALALGDVDFVLGDEWHHQPRPLAVGLERVDLLSDRVLLVLRGRHPVARRHREV